MKSKNFYLSSTTIDISENDLYLEMTNRLCYYDDSNLNNVMLPYVGYEDSAKEYAETLINMPVQAKYRKINNKDDLGGHECVRKLNGDVVFNTESIGVHTSVEIREDTVITVHGEEKTLPCLFAKSRIWKRNENIVNAIKRLFSEGKLNSSWEIATEEYIYKDGIKTLTKYAFFGNALLGTTIQPAYGGTSTALDLSDYDEDELMIAEAISKDLIANNGVIDISNEFDDTSIIDTKNILNSNKEAVMHKIDNKETVSEELDNQETSTENTETTKISEENKEADKESVYKNENSEEESEDEKKDEDVENSETVKVDTKAETSSLTVGDIARRITEQCEKKLDEWCYIFEFLPSENTVWVKKWCDDKDLKYYVFTYKVVDDEVIISDPQEGMLTVQISEVNSTIEEMKAEINEKNDAIIKSSEVIANKDSEIAELTVYKEKFEISEQEKIIAEQEAKKTELRDFALSSKFITSEELETSEDLNTMIENLDKDAIKGVIADRYISSMNSKSTKKVETSEVNNKNVTTNLNADEIDEVSAVRKYFLNK